MSSPLFDTEIKGADVSSLLEVEENGGRFFEAAGTPLKGCSRQPSAGDEAAEPTMAPSPEAAASDKAFPLRGRWPAGPDEVALPPEAAASDKAFPLRGRWPAGPDEVAPLPEAAASDKAFPLRGRWPAGPDEVAPSPEATASDKAFPLRGRWPAGPDEVAPSPEAAVSDKAFPLRGRWPAGPDEVAPQGSDLFDILKNNGVNLIRLRLWNHPYDSDGNPYGAGTNDLARTMTLARRAKAAGLPWLLDFHYSDFWADPGKQYPPKAWQDMDLPGLEQAVYDFTRSTLETLKTADLMPALVAPGNELSNGLLWPLGRTPNWANVARLVSAGVQAVRDGAPGLPVMLHLDNGGNNPLYRTWFDNYLANGGLDFDCIGLSYYPFWHGSLADLGANMKDLAARYGKPMVVAETSMAFTLAESNEFEGLDRDQKKGLAANERTAAQVPYPMTPEGQSAFLRDLWDVIQAVPDHLCRGFIWWEPAWLPVKNSGWATPGALAYIKEQGPGGNEWANQAMFDYEGRALPVLKTLGEL